eukprot:gene9682-20129_t
MNLFGVGFVTCDKGHSNGWWTRTQLEDKHEKFGPHPLKLEVEFGQ